MVSNRVDARRCDVGFSVLGGPTTVVDLGGRRFLMDPTFDELGPHEYLKKMVGPAIPADALGPIDAVLVSHNQHPDNFDDEGRRVARHTKYKPEFRDEVATLIVESNRSIAEVAREYGANETTVGGLGERKIPHRTRR